MTYDALISVVVPIRDAARTIEDVVSEIEVAVSPLFRHYEIVLVDDASDDDTVDVITQLQKHVRNLQLYCLNRRGGIDVAIVAGLDHSIGDFVVTMNPGEDPPELIPVLWEKAMAGSEVVCGIRKEKAHAVRSAMNHLFYQLYASSTSYRIPPDASDFRLLSRRVVSYITQNNDRHLLLKVLPFFPTRRISSVEYTPRHRPGGFGRRGWFSLASSASTIFLASSARPLRLLTLLSTLAGAISLFYAVYVVAVAIFKQQVVEGWVSLALPMAVMFFLVSLVLGFLSEYIYLLAQHSGNRPAYSIGLESTSSVLEVRKQLNVVDGEADKLTAR